MVERGNKGSFLYITHNLDCTPKVLCETFWGVQFCFNV